MKKGDYSKYSFALRQSTWENTTVALQIISNKTKMLIINANKIFLTKLFLDIVTNLGPQFVIAVVNMKDFFWGFKLLGEFKIFG